MRFLFLIVNNLCNINCSYCFYTTGYQKRSSLRIHQNKLSEFAAKIAQLKFDEVILTGGEPLHRKWKKETYVLIQELKKRRIKVILNTSATFLQNKDFNKIIKLKVDRVDISIDSHIPEIHNSQRGRYKDVVRTIKGLISRGYRNITTTTVVTEQNAPTLQDTIRWLYKIGIDDIRIQRPFLPRRKDKLLDDKKDIISNAMKLAASQLNAPHLNEYLNLTEAAFKKNSRTLNKLKTIALCRMGKQYFICDAIGNLIPCFHRPDIKLGNLFRDSISTIKAMLKNNELTNEKKLPECFGTYCVSLFDSPNFWRKKYGKNSGTSL